MTQYTRYPIPRRNPARVTYPVTLFALTPAAAAYELNLEPGGYVLTGVAAGAVSARAANAQAGAYTLTGSVAALTVAVELNAAPGAYGLTGSAAGLVAHRTLDAAASGYVLTGADADLAYTPAASDPMPTLTLAAR
jgi:hypothetical protein